MTRPTTARPVPNLTGQCNTVDQKYPFCYNIGIVTNKEPKMTEFEKNCYGMSTQDIREQYMPVSYTHLTLPTKRIV